jgi:hypothetical protein
MAAQCERSIDLHQAALDRPNCGEFLAAVGVTLGPLLLSLSRALSPVWRNRVSKYLPRWNPPPALWASRPGEETWASMEPDTSQSRQGRAGQDPE